MLAGGYADDEDEGTSFWYTGEGGQEAKGRQVSDRGGGGQEAGELQGGRGRRPRAGRCLDVLEGEGAAWRPSEHRR